MAAARHATTDLGSAQEEYWRTRDRRLEAQLVDAYEGLARSLAKKVASGNDREDALQVARCALMLALRRYDPQRGVAFSTFAWITITGELKRFVRDTGWVLHVERGLQERHLQVSTTVEELRRELGREPSLEEVCERSGGTPEQVREALGALVARRPGSIHARSTDVDAALEDRLGAEDLGFSATDDSELIGNLLARLPELDRSLVRGYWFGERTQVELAAEHGLSQMQVSRSLRRSLDRIRHLAVGSSRSSSPDAAGLQLAS